MRDFFDFLEACVVRFARLFVIDRSIEPSRPGAISITQSLAWSRKKIGQWSEKLDRCSLLQWKKVLRRGVPNGLAYAWPTSPKQQVLSQAPLAVDARDLLLSVIIACSLGSSVVAARVLGMQECEFVQQELSKLYSFKFRFGYPRALLRFALRGLRGPPFVASRKVQLLVFGSHSCVEVAAAVSKSLGHFLQKSGDYGNP